MINILIVDDHSIVRTSVKYLIQEEISNAQVHEACNAESTLKKIRKINFDLVVLDIHLDDTGINDLVVNIFRTKPSPKILIFTMSDESVFAKHFFRLGVQGFLSKESSEQEIKEAIRTVLKRDQYMSERLRSFLANEMIEKRRNPFEKLTEREFEILVLLVRGKSMTQISQILHLYITTIATHKQNMLEKLNVKNVVDLMIMAKEHNLWF